MDTGQILYIMFCLEPRAQLLVVHMVSLSPGLMIDLFIGSHLGTIHYPVV